MLLQHKDCFLNNRINVQYVTIQSTPKFPNWNLYFPRHVHYFLLTIPHCNASQDAMITIVGHLG